MKFDFKNAKYVLLVLLLIIAVVVISNKYKVNEEKEVFNNEIVDANQNVETSNVEIEYEKIRQYLESQIAWKAYDGVDFCSFTVLNENIFDKELYLIYECNEFYVRTSKLSCALEDELYECQKQGAFYNRDEQEKISNCGSSCKIEDIEPALKLGSGVSSVIEITRNDDGSFSHWNPEDGSNYGSSIKKRFPSKYYSMLFNDDYNRAKRKAHYENIERAEDYFSMKVNKTIEEVLNKECDTFMDCEGTLPFDYAIRSNCPYESVCIDGQCTVVCPDYH